MQLDAAARVDIALQVASGVEYMHTHKRSPIVHGDLKPEWVVHARAEVQGSQKQQQEHSQVMRLCRCV